MQSALQSRSLLPIETESTVVMDATCGLKFLISRPRDGKIFKPSNLELEVQERQKRLEAEEAAAAAADEEEQRQSRGNAVATNRPPSAPPRIAFDVFRPYDSGVTVLDSLCDGTHALLLNKFPAIEEHLLLITKPFESQTDHISLQDFRATIDVMFQLDNDRDWLAFFNRGLFSGASQPHKHLQLVPQYRTTGSDCIFPMTPIFNDLALRQRDVKRVGQFPFHHSFRSIGHLFEKHGNNSNALATALYSVYCEMLRELGLMLGESHEHEEDDQHMIVVCDTKNEFIRKLSDAGLVQRNLGNDDMDLESLNLDEIVQRGLMPDTIEWHRVSVSAKHSLSYNALFSNKWILIVPRRRENYEGISLNSLGFVCSYFAMTERDVCLMKDEVGLLNFMCHMTFPINTHIISGMSNTGRH